MATSIKNPAVAGSFYPASKFELDALVDELLRGPHHGPDVSPCPKAIIAPHAGYVYSGPIAGSAFRLLQPHADRIERIVLLGPAHRAWIEGLASPGAAAMRTPLGDIEVDLDSCSGIPVSAAAHAREHSLEVELPFIQKVAPHAKVVPLAVGSVAPGEVARTLERLWGGPETVIVVSSDLSHYLPYELGRDVDQSTADRIVRLEAVSGEEACGAAGIEGLLEIARKKGLTSKLLDLRSSGDTAGSRDEVVGYGAFAFYEGGQ